MKFDEHKPLDIALNDLFERYSEGVPAVNQITAALVEKGVVASQQDIVNDHIAFRTLGLPHLGIASLAKIFLHYGYTQRDHYHFEKKKLNAYWFSPPEPVYPRIFISELRVEELSPEAQQIIKKYTAGIHSDPVDALDVDNGAEVGAFFQKPLWDRPTKADYLRLLEENEYAAWVIYNRYYLNHYTISVHALKNGYNTIEDFNTFVEGLGIRLNTEGGKIKTSPDGLLSQSSTVAEMKEALFAGGETLAIAGSYVEFAERRPLLEFSHIPAEQLTPAQRREGFETGNADKIFESTYTSQTKK